MSLNVFKIPQMLVFFRYPLAHMLSLLQDIWQGCLPLVFASPTLESELTLSLPSCFFLPLSEVEAAPVPDQA